MNKYTKEQLREAAKTLKRLSAQRNKQTDMPPAYELYALRNRIKALKSGKLAVVQISYSARRMLRVLPIGNGTFFKVYEKPYLGAGLMEFKPSQVRTKWKKTIDAARLLGFPERVCADLHRRLKKAKEA